MPLDQIDGLYNKTHQPASTEDVMFCNSSQEAVDLLTQGSTSAPAVWDPDCVCMVKTENGEIVKSTMVRGSTGFWIAQFTDGTVVATEFSNLIECGSSMLPRASNKRAEKPCMKRPASVPAQKRPAAAALADDAEHEAFILPAKVVKRQKEGQEGAYVMAPKFVRGLMKKKHVNYMDIVKRVAQEIDDKKITCKADAILLMRALQAE